MKTPDTKPGLPQHDRFTLWWVTSWFAIRHLLHFRSLHWVGETSFPDRPVLLIQNHFSWWDGYWAWLVSRRVGKRFYVMMLEEQIEAHPFLAKCGAFPVKPGSRQVVEAIRMAATLLEDSRNMVVVFPQGAIQTQHLGQLSFATGVERILGGSTPKPALLFASVLTDYFSSPRPSVTIRLKEHNASLSAGGSLESHYNQFFSDSIVQQKES